MFVIQAELFKATVLKVEGDNVSAPECANHLEFLKGDIMLRKTERYVDIATENELKKIIAAKQSERAPIEEAIIAFYGMCGH